MIKTFILILHPKKNFLSQLIFESINNEAIDAIILTIVLVFDAGFFREEDLIGSRDK